ncbi:transcriptional regulator, TetR family [Cellulomonas flavigena DSM 20109]|uniref:Transcriptional regulator, TetR family n=1 Tax=Cellulomonas flavigena (strain ATCC 482 / DSM 20109 / BCRC 11376 / JCM 18109 / NBRC 3775 / NCIMB 8073 / NRS 134) TaxID=446466 RepID=D5UID9_CELFN|nr:TetR/AcrR family transcriptional regulator [Cellulomonas flavigena]ADG73438.1 transcriptional regulator, TetR family [Cellulomonas flavigena DSM 20109]
MPAHAPATPVARRERLRQQTVDEIKAHAFALVDAGGAQEVTIASVGKAMGLTPPALYRYFASREALVAALVVDAYADLGATVARAAQDAADQGAAERVRRMLGTYRDWALAHPRRYTLLFSDRTRDVPDSPDGVAAVNVGMLPLLVTLGEIAPGAPDDASPLGEGLRRWAEAIGGPADLSPATLRLAVLAWSRVHGLVSLEITGALDGMGLDAGTLVATEIEHLVEAANR